MNHQMCTSCNTKQKPTLTSIPTAAQTPELQTPNNNTEHQVTKHKPVTPNQNKTPQNLNTKTRKHTSKTHYNLPTTKPRNHSKSSKPSKPQNHQTHQNLQTGISNPTINIIPCNTPRANFRADYLLNGFGALKSRVFQADFLHNRASDERACVWKHIVDDIIFPKPPCSCLLCSPVVCRENHRLRKLPTVRSSGYVYLALLYSKPPTFTKPPQKQQTTNFQKPPNH